MDRCNLTILEEEGFDSLAGFLAEHDVEVIASMPCYLEENVDRQRGKGAFTKSIKGLKRLNALGYGKSDKLKLNLVFNPQGPCLPPDQNVLEADYKKILFEQYGIEFNQLLALANMPIKRFGSMLISKGEFDSYMELLKSSHKEENVDSVMCKTLLSIDWLGYVYDCDFNQMLGLHSNLNNGKTHLKDLMTFDFNNQDIVVMDHCFGCTAGQGSSCGGAL
jgi:radical SAM/Cys-rich protein